MNSLKGQHINKWFNLEDEGYEVDDKIYFVEDDSKTEGIITEVDEMDETVFIDDIMYPYYYITKQRGKYLKMRLIRKEITYKELDDLNNLYPEFLI